MAVAGAEALVSCLCPTRGRVPMLRQAVAGFLAQTYQSRELIVLFQADDSATRDYLATLNEPSIRALEIPVSPQLGKGSLRNIALGAARGHYVALWDDDDSHGPMRLAEQIAAIRGSGRSACVLRHVVLHDGTTQSSFLSVGRPWECTLVAERSAMPLFANEYQGSDTSVVVRLRDENRLVAIENPELYVKVFHGGNSWDRAHWEKNLLPYARPLPRVAPIAMLALLLSLMLDASPAMAKTLYRCGNTFSATPCGDDATEIHVAKFNAEGSAGDTKATAAACAAAVRAKRRIDDEDALRVDDISAGTATLIEYNYVQIIAREYRLALSSRTPDGDYASRGSITCITSEDGQRVLELR